MDDFEKSIDMENAVQTLHLPGDSANADPGSTSVRRLSPPNKRARPEELEQILIPEEVSPPASSDEQSQELPGTAQSEYAPRFHGLFHVNELPQKRKYSRTFKKFLLKLFFKHPKAYRLLQTTYNLPRISTLYRLCIPATTLENETVLAALQMKVNLMSPEQRVCAVCVGSMAVAANVQYDAKRDKMVGVHEVEGVQTLEPARTALIITVRGLFHNWKQAVAFSFLGNFHDTIEVKMSIYRIINRLFKLGLKVVTYVTDLDTDKVTGVTGDRQLSVTDPTITVGQRKIYLFYDPLHLLKTMRDSMLTNDIDFSPTNQCAMWSDVVKCYQLDSDHKNRLMPLAPKLTQNHIKPVPGAMDDLQLTADVFSRETARAISAYIDSNAIKSKATATVRWILIVSKCLDTLNFGSKIPSRDKSLVFSGKTAHVEFLVEMLSTFQKVRLIAFRPACAPHPRIPPYAKAFRVTINALLLLYRQLKAENCWLPLVGLSLDCLDDFFYKTQKKYGFVVPTTGQVIDCIVTFPICTIFQYFCSKKQSSNELRIFMSKIRHIEDMEKYDDSAVERDPCADEYTEFCSVQLSAEHGVEHLAMYLLYKACQRHGHCPLMQQYWSCDDAVAADKQGNPEALHVGISITKDGIIVNAVPRNFYEFIDKLETLFKDYFQKKHVTLSMSRLQLFINDLFFEMPCGCFPIDYVKLLYLRFRLYLTLKYNNQLFESLAPDESKRALVVNDL